MACLLEVVNTPVSTDFVEAKNQSYFLHRYVAQLTYTTVRLEWFITIIFANLKAFLTFHLFLLCSVDLVPKATKVAYNSCLFHGILFILIC